MEDDMSAKYQTVTVRGLGSWMMAVRYVWDKPQFSVDAGKTWHKSPRAAILAYQAA